MHEVDDGDEVAGGAVAADAILDRLVHHAHRIPLKGASMRREKKKPDPSPSPDTL